MNTMTTISNAGPAPEPANQATPENTYWIQPSVESLIAEASRRYGEMLKRLAE